MLLRALFKTGIKRKARTPPIKAASYCCIETRFNNVFEASFETFKYVIINFSVTADIASIFIDAPKRKPTSVNSFALVFERPLEARQQTHTIKTSERLPAINVKIIAGIFVGVSDKSAHTTGEIKAAAAEQVKLKAAALKNRMKLNIISAIKRSRDIL